MYNYILLSYHTHRCEVLWSRVIRGLYRKVTNKLYWPKKAQIVGLFPKRWPVQPWLHFSVRYLNPIPTRGHRFCPPPKRLHQRYPCEYIHRAWSVDYHLCLCIAVTPQWMQGWLKNVKKVYSTYQRFHLFETVYDFQNQLIMVPKTPQLWACYITYQGLWARIHDLGVLNMY